LTVRIPSGAQEITLGKIWLIRSRLGSVKITLHYAPITCSLVPYIALVEAAAEFDVHVVDFKKGDHVSAEYLLINPKHKVPALTIDGETLMENVSILQWIAAAYPLAALLPRGGLNEFRACATLPSTCCHLSRASSGSGVPTSPSAIRRLRPKRA
jgi:glutathione S-transferase